jgi:hypothetical protein|tara:strand:- start:40 stop:744 length:705 start_codon:yes stop_codon:yes gene_type:complete
MGYLDSAFIIISIILLIVLVTVAIITVSLILPNNTLLTEKKKDNLNSIVFLSIPFIWATYTLVGVGFRFNLNFDFFLFLVGIPLTFIVIRSLYRKSVILEDRDQRRKSLMWTHLIMFLFINLLYYPIAWTQERGGGQEYQPMVHLCLLGFLTIYISIGGFLKFKGQLKKKWIEAFCSGCIFLLFPIGFMIINAINCSGFDCSFGDAFGVIAIILILIVVIFISIIEGFRNRTHL